MQFDSSQPAYIALRDLVSERTRPLLLWVGAGLSRPAGIPGWRELRDKLVIIANTKAQSTLNELEHAEQVANAARIAAAESDIWVALEILKKALGNATYHATIKELMNPENVAPIPETYKILWRLPVSGLLTLNLDRFASRAHAQVTEGAAIVEFSGNKAGEFAHVLQNPTQFIANLHGITEDTSSWVFTSGELNYLLNNQGYAAFINACLLSRTIIFIGITASDVASGGHLDRMQTLGINPGTHFWFTSQADKQTDKWAESANIRLIHYPASDNNHSTLNEAITGLVKYLSPERPTTPVTPTASLVSSNSTILPPGDLCRLPSDQIRQQLNSHAASLLSSGSSAAASNYTQFCQTYRAAIYRAWDITIQPPDNSLLGYTLTETMAQGAFGCVYRAISPTGQSVAVKVLHGEIRTNQAMLDGFRRGVESMRILSDNKISGMVPYIAASEIPATAIMELIDGPDLEEAVQRQYLNDWSTILCIAIRLAEIIRSAHLLPQRVLHRDLKPSNIMLKGYYTDIDNWEVVVLDFDLSWHRDATGLSIDTSNTMSGFLAPEQIEQDKKNLTRNALVDSYGLGMTLYYLRSCREPVFGQHRYTTWQSDLNNIIEAYKCDQWQSLPMRFARLIEAATRHKQAERWDMTQILGELQRLDQALKNPQSVLAADMLAEELATRAHLATGYKWDQDHFRATVSLKTGATVVISTTEFQDAVMVDITWVDEGSMHRQNLHKFLVRATETARAIFNKCNWDFKVLNSSSGRIHVNAKISVGLLRTYMNNCVQAVSEAVNQFALKK